jgi:hypothetical protein
VVFRRRPAKSALVHAVTALALGLMLALAAAPAQAQPGADDSQVCPAIVAQAMDSLNQNCTGVGRNTACYGYNLVNATFNQPVPDDYFSVPADRAGLRELQSISTAPIDLVSNHWGVALMSMQANLPGTLPGQSVNFLLLGDATVVNAVDPAMAPEPGPSIAVLALAESTLRTLPQANSNAAGVIRAGAALRADAIDSSGAWVRVAYIDAALPGGGLGGWLPVEALSGFDTSLLEVFSPDARLPMQAFVFRTGIGQPLCSSVPNQVIVQGPQNTAILLNINGAEIVLGSTIALTSIGGAPPEILAQLNLPPEVVSRLQPDPQAGGPTATPTPSGVQAGRCGIMQLTVLSGEVLLNGAGVSLPAGNTAYSAYCESPPAQTDAAATPTSTLPGATPAADDATADAPTRTASATPAAQPVALGAWGGFRPLEPEEIEQQRIVEQIASEVIQYQVELPAPEEIQPVVFNTATPEPTQTFTPTETPSETPTATPSETLTLTPTATPSATLTETPTLTRTPTETDTLTPRPTRTPTESDTLTPRPTRTRTPIPVATRTLVPTLTPSQSVMIEAPVPTNVPTLTATSSRTPTFTPTWTPTHTPSSTFTAMFTASDTFTATHTPSSTFTVTPTATETPEFMLQIVPPDDPMATPMPQPNISITTTCFIPDASKMLTVVQNIGDADAVGTLTIRNSGSDDIIPVRLAPGASLRLSLSSVGESGASMSYKRFDTIELEAVFVTCRRPSSTPSSTPTHTPSSTFTAMFTASDTFTATHTPSNTPVGLLKVRLTSLCSSDPAVQRRWRLNNPSPVALTVNWAVSGSPTGQASRIIVPAAQGPDEGIAIFFTNTEPGPNTTIISVGGVQHDVKASSGARCVLPSDTPTSTPSNTPTFTPSNTPTVTFTPSNTPSETFTPSLTATPTDTFTWTPSPSETPTPEPVLLSSELICAEDGTSASLTLSNVGAIDMPSAGQMWITGTDGVVGAPFAFQLAAGASITVTIGPQDSIRGEFANGEHNESFSFDANCA